MLNVYIMNINEVDLSKPHKISSIRAEKVAKLKKEEMKKQSVAAELLINKGMEELFPDIETPVIWEYDKYGKPYLLNYPDVYMNVSHSGEYAVCAFADTPVGIDIQYMRDVNLNVIDRYFTNEESEYIKSYTEKFYELWVKKESFSKAVGKGLQLPLKEISVLEDTVLYNGDVYKFKPHYADKEYKMCICIKE